MNTSKYEELPTKQISTQKKAGPHWICLIVAVLLVTIVVLAAVPPLVLRHHHHAGQPLAGQTLVQPLPGSLGDTTVRIRDGFLRGVYKDGVRVFHGVPFAEPPVGDLRWKSPRPKTPWHPAVWNAAIKRPACLQNSHSLFPESSTSEDCLYLEVFCPHKPLMGETRSFPVLVYLHGGAYKYYSATDSMFDATQLVKRTGIVVVLVEYRLGAMGFLVSGHEDQEGSNHLVEGNYGLQDQLLALQWVKENIHAFGGDPQRVTLAGQSAGAQSAIVHLLSRSSSKYFRSVILESPPAPTPVKTFRQGMAQTRLVAKVAGCPDLTNGSVDMTCLRHASSDTILRAQKMSKSFSDRYTDRIEPWGPVIDQKLVSGPLMDGFKDGHGVPDIPILWGVTSQEAVLFMSYLHPKPSSILLYMFAMKIFSGMGVNSLKLAKLYPMVSKDSRVDIAHMLTDYLFRCPLKWSAHQLTAKSLNPSLWTYVFDRSVPIASDSSLSICNKRACHAMEIPYVFNTFGSFNITVTDADQRISQSIMEYYGNFIKHGDPNCRDGNDDDDDNKDEAENELALSQPHWPRAYQDGGYQTLVFGKTGDVTIGEGVKDEKCGLWKELYP